MIKHITLSAEETVIRQARQRAVAENTTLDALFRGWLQEYVAQDVVLEQYEELMIRLDHARTGGTFSRDEMNARD